MLVLKAQAQQENALEAGNTAKFQGYAKHVSIMKNVG
jgi:hypothetical protein